ncbi:transposase [Streptomyces sp. NPDC001792]|uniref:transposase n=1 Tax=Streptomyces sp. NPDC001792 TaxID=3154524 RepID=UPI003334A18D
MNSRSSAPKSPHTLRMTSSQRVRIGPVKTPAIERTLHAANEAANRVSSVAFDRFGLKGSVRELRTLCYGELKAHGFGAQAAQHVIKRVGDAYTTLRAGIKAGNLGPKHSKRRRRAASKPIVFRPDAAHTYDDRCLSWNYDAQRVSLWTLDGRLKNVQFACSPGTLKQFAEHRKGETDLIERDGTLFLFATIDLPEPEVFEPKGFIGVDRGINNLATTSDGDNHSGRRLGRYRRWQACRKAEIQAKQTRSAKQLLTKRARREARHATPINHKVSKTVVAVAQRTGRGIALEELRVSASGSRFRATSEHASPSATADGPAGTRRASAGPCRPCASARAREPTSWRGSPAAPPRSPSWAPHAARTCTT